MTVLVIGGCGYIGSHVVKALVEGGQSVVVFDNLETGYDKARQRVEALTGAAVPLFTGDIRNPDDLSRCFGEHAIDAVIHFAAYKNPGESVTEIAKYYRNNVLGLINVVEAMRGAGATKLVFSSSCSVYGTPASNPVDESFPTAPESPYGDSKRIGEMLLRDYCATGAIRATSLRYFNASGADPSGDLGEDPSISMNLIPIAMKVLRGELAEVKVFGDDYDTADGTCIRDYIHISDLASGHVKALEALADRDGHHVYNLGTGTGASVLEVLEELRAQSGQPIPHQVVARRPGDPTQIFGDPSKAETELQWQANFGIKEIIRDTLLWQHKHPSGYQ
ncbi:MAG: UDP-glucose 4-epimerase GalE [Planctomycetota bacterium]